LFAHGTVASARVTEKFTRQLRLVSRDATPERRKRIALNGTHGTGRRPQKRSRRNLVPAEAVVASAEGTGSDFGGRNPKPASTMTREALVGALCKNSPLFEARSVSEPFADDSLTIAANRRAFKRQQSSTMLAIRIWYHLLPARDKPITSAPLTGAQEAMRLEKG
jgi:hypothetical protein